MAKDKNRIIELQRSLRIARQALELIAHGHSHSPHTTAGNALYEMMPLERKAPLQGLVGHERRRP